MSGLDPLAALAAQAVASAQAAMDEATLSLGADVAVLQAQISVGDVIPATVLPPQGGSDLLSFLGQTVVAQIPPGVHPGESLLLQVTGFTPTAVLVRNLGTVDPQNPIPTIEVELPPAAPGAPQTAVLTTDVNRSPPLPPQSPPVAGSPPPAPAGVAPPPAVFVAAAVRAAAPASSDGGAAPKTPAAALPVAALENELETRIAVDRTRAGALPGPPPAGRPATAPPTTISRPLVVPPIVRPAGAPATAAARAADVTARAAEQTPEGALLGRLRVPVTPTTLAAARVFSNATQSLTDAYERLDALLARTAPPSVPVALRSMLSFVSRMDLRSTAALPEQIAAFVNDVVDGAEAKLAQIVQTWVSSAATDSAERPPAAASALAQPAPASGATPTNVLQPSAPLPVATAAQAAERGAALDYNVKSAILTMIAQSVRDGGSPALTAALHDALAATTAVQLNALSAQNADSSTIALALPAYFHPGGAPVQLKISRDARGRKKAMDADNFHIAFVLDTASLGVVAIDVQTAGRAVSVEVKTQAALSAERFRSTLGDLRSRLELLRYRVAKIGAGVAPAAGPAAEPPVTTAPPARRSLWDTQA